MDIQPRHDWKDEVEPSTEPRPGTQYRAQLCTACFMRPTACDLPVDPVKTGGCPEDWAYCRKVHYMQMWSGKGYNPST
jgi:hypothetical protein